MDLVLANKVVGVVMGILGSFLIAPSAFLFWRRAPTRFADVVRRRWRERRGGHLTEIAAGMREGDTVTTVGISRQAKWAINSVAELAEIVTALQASVSALTMRVSQTEFGVAAERGTREAEIAEHGDAIRQVATGLQFYKHAQEQLDQRLNGRGFPLIAVSLILTAFPDELGQMALLGRLAPIVGILLTVGIVLAAIRDIPAVLRP